MDDNADWRPPTEDGPYDRARVARLQPIKDAIDRLGLPPLQLRKPHSILMALEMQIETGGDSPEANGFLLSALRAAVRHHAGPEGGQDVLAAIDAFEAAEAERWDQMRAGTLPEIPQTPEEQLEGLLFAGYEEFKKDNAAASDLWLRAWELVKSMVTPAIRTAEGFDRQYPMLGIFLSNWCWDLEEALRVAGVDDASYHERLLAFARDYQAAFPDEEPLTRANWRQIEADVLFDLGRGAEADAIMEELVTEFPTWGWLHLNWARHYLRQSDENGYAAAERILLRALEEPELEVRHLLLGNLVDLYENWGRSEEAAPYRKELRQIERRRQEESGRKPSPGSGLKSGPKRRKRKR